MGEDRVQKKYLNILIITSLVFLTVGLYFHSVENFLVYRLIRSLICFTFLFFIIKFNREKVSNLLILFVILYGFSSFATLWYETEWMAVISLLLNLLSYCALILALIPKVKFGEMNFLFKSIFVALVAVNGYLLYLLLDMIRDLGTSDVHYFAMLVSTMLIVVLGFLALLYNHSYSTQPSIVFCLFVFGIIFAEVFRAIGYYDFGYGNSAVHLARGLLLVSFSLLLYYTLLPKEKSEKLGRL